jgi:hypothetical protein
MRKDIGLESIRIVKERYGKNGGALVASHGIGIFYTSLEFVLIIELSQ